VPLVIAFANEEIGRSLVVITDQVPFPRNISVELPVDPGTTPL
jgi:hypothetical protein